MEKKIDENIVAENIKQIIEKLDVSATIEVSKQENIFFIDISSEDSSLLIGKHGVNLESLQFVLAVRLKTISGEEDFEVYLDVNNWRKQKEDRLRQMAQSIAEKVAATGKEQTLYNLKPSERRVIHMLFSENQNISTVSEGEGVDRYLIIKPKK